MPRRLCHASRRCRNWNHRISGQQELQTRRPSGRDCGLQVGFQADKNTATSALSKKPNSIAICYECEKRQEAEVKSLRSRQRNAG
jgi:hypothetical protein